MAMNVAPQQHASLMCLYYVSNFAKKLGSYHLRYFYIWVLQTFLLLQKPYMMTYYLLTHILLTMSTGNEREGKDDIRIKIFTHYGKMLFERIFKEVHFS